MDNTIYRILQEITELNPSFTETRKENLGQDFKQVANFRNEIQYKYNKLETIKSWTNKEKLKTQKSSKHKKIAIIWKAMELSSGLAVRDIQIFALLTLYCPGAGKMVQIETGEGKTLIIAMLAVLFCLDGKKVDIGK